MSDTFTDDILIHLVLTFDSNNNNNTTLFSDRNGSIENTIHTYRAEHVNITQITKQAAYRSDSIDTYTEDLWLTATTDLSFATSTSTSSVK